MYTFLWYRRSGFTLVEIMIAVSIIALLIVIPFFFFSRISAASRDEKRKADVATISQALEDYKNQFGRYPDDLNDLVTQGILSELPVDPLHGELVPGEDDVYYGYANNYDPTNGNQAYSLVVPLETGVGGSSGPSYFVYTPNGPGTAVSGFPTTNQSLFPSSTGIPSPTNFLSITATPIVTNTHTPTPNLTVIISATITPGGPTVTVTPATGACCFAAYPVWCNQ